MWDVVVAGAGPAGAVAAYVLAQRGRRVLLADACDAGSLKIGEALPGAAVRLLRSIDLPAPSRDGPHTPIGGNLSSWNSDQLVATDFIREPDGPGWRLDRLRFDANLRAGAIRAGAGYRPARVMDVERRDASWVIKFEDGSTDVAQWIVDATGRRASIARRLGAKRLRDARLIALYAIGASVASFRLNRTIIEAVPRGWWYTARLPSGQPIAGFHTHAREAVRLTSDAHGWRQALAETCHVGPMLADAVFDRPLKPLDACGAQLDHFGGDGWLACGDAAVSFDPISGQGIFSALYGGMMAGRTISDTLNGGKARLNEYSKRLENVRRLYVTRSCAIYRSERRWIAEPFWSIFSKEIELSRVKRGQSIVSEFSNEAAMRS
jgi:flavin-dependent dehydrogenase